ncbi:Uncharacterised protein [Sphingomonas paucimobilis]|nr:Uncharacterised protein [Sphingomonas paucimobilis]
MTMRPKPQAFRIAVIGVATALTGACGGGSGQDEP